MSDRTYFARALAGVQAQISANTRLQWMLLGLSLVIVSQGCWMLWDARNRFLAETARSQERFALISSLKDDSEWKDQLLATEKLAGRLEAEIAQVGSPGLAQATLQSWLQARAEGMDGQPTFQVASPRREEDVPDVVRVTATMSGRSHRDTVLDLVSRIETSSNLMVVDALTLNADSALGFSMTISAYFKVESALEDERQ